MCPVGPVCESHLEGLVDCLLPITHLDGSTIIFNFKDDVNFNREPEPVIEDSLDAADAAESSLLQTSLALVHLCSLTF